MELVPDFTILGQRERPDQSALSCNTHAHTRTHETSLSYTHLVTLSSFPAKVSNARQLLTAFLSGNSQGLAI